MRSFRILIAGVTFTTLLLVLPAAYLTRWTGTPPSPMLLAFIGLPFAVLLWTLARPQPWLTHGAYFVAHLPALLVEPGLSGPLVYSNTVGIWAVAALGCVGLAWLWVCHGSREAMGASGTPSRFSLDALGVLVGFVAASTYGAFLISALESDAVDDGFPSSLTILIGVTVTWYVAGNLVANRLGDVFVREGARRRVLASLFVERQRSNADLLTTILWLVVASIGALFWHLV